MLKIKLHPVCVPDVDLDPILYKAVVINSPKSLCKQFTCTCSCIYIHTFKLLRNVLNALLYIHIFTRA